MNRKLSIYPRSKQVMMQHFNKIDLHVHSTFSDGSNSPEDIIRHAILNNYEKIAIVDHVRRTSNWVDKFVFEIERLKHVYQGQIVLYSGIEAKVINLTGDVDARPEFFTKVDLVLGAFHRLPKGEEQYFTDTEIINNKGKALEFWFIGFMKLLENRFVHIIAHPTAILKRYDISVPCDMKNAIAKAAANYGKILEINSKYQVPDQEFIAILRSYSVKVSFGSDSHSLEEM